MERKLFLAAAIFIFLLGIAFPALVLRMEPELELDLTEVNDIVKEVEKQWADIAGHRTIPEFPYEIDYVILDSEDNLILASRRGLNEDIWYAIRNQDTILDIKSDNEILGKLIIYNDAAGELAVYRRRLAAVFAIASLALLILLLGYALYLNKAILQPFKDMERFAANIASGKLDVPLQMDRSNIFGAFTESFDIMREELNHARENERRADQSKKELIASLSHDIKTPLASIKAVSELMSVQNRSDHDRKQIETIIEKCGQIEELINNLFHTTLEELTELTVHPSEAESMAIIKLIENSDYKHRVKDFHIPPCIILADIRRLQQVIDNIISNSYKYAGTAIEISSCFEDEYLSVEIMDFGEGVPEDELPLLLSKYYRGKNAAHEKGYGLGLYICKSVMERMAGNLECYNEKGGFIVKLTLPLA